MCNRRPGVEPCWVVTRERQHLWLTPVLFAAGVCSVLLCLQESVVRLIVERSLEIDVEIKVGAVSTIACSLALLIAKGSTFCIERAGVLVI